MTLQKMYGICGQPYLNLDPFIDVPKLESLHEEICFGIAQSYIEWMSWGTHILDSSPQKNLHAHLESFRKSTAYGPRFAKLTLSQQVLLCQLLTPVENGTKMICLRYCPTSWRLKHLAEHCVDHPNASLFPGLMDYVQKLPFSEIGRVVIFLQEPFQNTLAHVDEDRDKLRAQHDDVPDDFGYEGLSREFIWLQTQIYPRLYVANRDLSEKHFVKSHAAFFSSFDVHGTDPLPFTTFSIRVDGVFDRDFCRSLGLRRPD